MTIQKVDMLSSYIIRLKNGEDILKGLERKIESANIKNGIIVSGIGSVTSYHIHVVKTKELPPGNIYFKEDEPFDIVNVQGYIMNGRIHAHISFADAESGKQFGGHLEKGCNVLTFCIITIIETEALGDLDDYKITK